MRPYSIYSFSDELEGIIKNAEDSGHRRHGVLSSLKDAIGPALPALGIGLYQDIRSGRDVGADLTALAERVRSPSKFREGLGDAASMYFLGSNAPGAKKATLFDRALPVALNTALPLMSLPSVIAKKDRSGQGRSRFARAAELAGNVAGGLLGARMGGTAAAITGLAGSALGKGVGAGVDYLTGHREEED